jgi:hypothetical protein
MTIEEQIQKADCTEEPVVEPDELDDIDKVRDDLQSTKQMLALEMRNKEAMERDNKKLLVTIEIRVIHGVFSRTGLALQCVLGIAHRGLKYVTNTP